MSARLRHRGTTWDGKRRITNVRPEYGPPDGLYRISWGNGRTEVDETFDACCEWCGEWPGRLYSYDATFDEAHRRDEQLPGSLYCNLHCWGQATGWTDL